MLIIDDFLNFPELRRAEALEAKFNTEQGFPGIAFTCHAEDLGSKGLKHAKSFSLINFFRLTLKHYELPTYIHTDAAMAEYTGILYLNKKGPPHGTQFWRHKHSGLSCLPEVVSQDWDRDGLDESLWEPTERVEAKFNRFILFNSRLFHSPWPRQGFGDSVANGRLIEVFFVDGVR